MTAFPFVRVLQPLRLSAGLRLKNRIYFAPMGIDAAEEDGTASDEMTTFYRGIIAGGCGMVVLGNASIHPSSRLQRRGLCLHDAAQARALAPLLRMGDEHDCPVVIQLQHYGAQGRATRCGGPLLSPSGVPCPRMAAADPGYRTVPMTVADIAEVTRQFVAAAGLAVGAGARMVQLQASNGYLLSSFLSPHTNRRTDAYGGDPARRMRFLLEVLRAIREAHPGLRASTDGVVTGRAIEPGQIVSAGQVVLRIAETAGLDTEIDLPEALYAERDRLAARFTPWGDPDRRIAVALREISPVADPATHMHHARFALPEDEAAGLAFGNTGWLALERANAGAGLTRVPRAALFDDGLGGSPAVWRVEGDRLHRLPVTVRQLEAESALVETGTEGPIEIVALGANRLQDGQPVHSVERGSE